MTTNSHHPPTIIARFARQLSHIIADYLTNPNLGDKRHPLTDRIAAKLILILSESKRYRDELLFRDYSLTADELWQDYILLGNSKKVHIESINYLQNVLSKRLTIVAKHKSLPTNLHILLLKLCHYSTDNNWLETKIERSNTEQIARINAPFFQVIEKILKRQCQKLKQMGAVSKTYREEYGVLYLTAGENRAEVVEEISLFDVLDAVPVPLKPTIKEKPTWYIPLVEHILISLNENYGLLRSCGLPPQEWNEEHLSIGKLRELKNLKKAADSYLKTGEKKNVYSAYREAFSDLQRKKDEIAGFKDFSDFAGSEVGAAMLKTDFVSLFPEDEGDENLLEKIVSLENGGSSVFSEEKHDKSLLENNIELKEEAENFLIEHVDKFTPLSAYFFKQVVILQRPLDGEDGVLNDAEFQYWLATDQTYANLDSDKLISKLIQKITLLIEKYKLNGLSDF